MIFGIRAVIEAINAGKEIEKIFIRREMGGDLLKELFDLVQERKIPVQKVCRMRVKYVPASQRIALFKKNFCVSDCGKSKNDIQLENILKFYNEYFSKEDTLLKRIKTNADYI